MARTIPTICACCGALFQARCVQAAYCHVNCRRRARYYREQGRPVPPKGSKWTQPIRPAVVQPEIPPTTTRSLEVREWQGTPIQRRAADGYVNATAMCQANGREWFTYARSVRTQEYIAALKASPQICGDIIRAITTGPNDQRGTWVHPRLAVDLARWISPAFAVWMDGWFLEAMTGAAPQPQRLPKGVHVIADTEEQAALMLGDTLWRALHRAVSAPGPGLYHWHQPRLL